MVQNHREGLAEPGLYVTGAGPGYSGPVPTQLTSDEIIPETTELFLRFGADVLADERVKCFMFQEQ